MNDAHAEGQLVSMGGEMAGAPAEAVLLMAMDNPRVIRRAVELALRL